jgi:hypothetical protein
VNIRWFEGAFAAPLLMALAGCSGASRLVQARAPGAAESAAKGPIVLASAVACLAPGEEAALAEIGQPRPHDPGATGPYHTPEAADFTKLVDGRVGVASAPVPEGAAKAACYRKANQGDLEAFVKEAAKLSSAQTVLVPIFYTIARCEKGEGDKATCRRDEIEAHLALFAADGTRLWDSFERQRDESADGNKTVAELVGDVFSNLPATGFTAAKEAEKPVEQKAEPEFEVEEALTDLDPKGNPDCRKWARMMCEATTGSNAEREAGCKDAADKANKAGKGKGAAAACAGMLKKLGGGK